MARWTAALTSLVDVPCLERKLTHNGVLPAVRVATEDRLGSCLC